MKAVLQRVEKACVSVEEKGIGSIGKGILVFVGVGKEDTLEDVLYLVPKILNLRIFEDSLSKMNLSLLDIKGQIMVISQFTLYGDCKKGRRPSFDKAASPAMAKELYIKFIEEVKKYPIEVVGGSFGDHMSIDLVNDGPVTFILDSRYPND